MAGGNCRCLHWLSGVGVERKERRRAISVVAQSEKNVLLVALCVAEA